MIKILENNSIKIICPENRIDNYLAYCGHVFRVKKIKFFKKIKLLEDHTDVLFIDQKSLVNDRLNLLFDKKINLIIILLWNSDRDYKTYKSKIILLERKFNVKLLSLSNFSKKIYLPLNTFTIKKKSSLKSISGIGILKRIKFNFPLIYGLYNFIKHFKEAKTFLKNKKLVFVGIGNKNDAINQLIWVRNKNYSKKINKICKKIISDIKRSDYIEFSQKFYSIFNTKNFQDLSIPIKYFLTQVITRYLILSHLIKFKNFYHKNDSSYPLDLLRGKIYNKIYHLDLGSQSGNAKTHMRKIYLTKFYKDKFLEVNAFKDNEDYTKKKIFKIRFNKFHNKLSKFYNFQNYSANLSELLTNLKKIKSS